MMNKRNAILATVILLTTIYMYRPKPEKATVSPEVESAINSIALEPESVYRYTNAESSLGEPVLVDWGSATIRCAFPRRDDDGHISINHLKPRQSVLKRSCDVPLHR